MTLGITANVTLDGVDLDWLPDSVSIDPETNELAVRTRGDTFLYRDQVLAGLPDVEECWRSISFPAGGGETDAERRLLQLLRVRGGFHTLALWVPERMVYTATAGQTLFYFGRRRRDAGIVYAKTTEFPVTITRNATSQTVVVVAGSSPAVPASGVANVATLAVSTGSYQDYSAFAVSACAAGDVIEATIRPVLRVYWERARVDYRSVIERHDGAFVER